MQNGKILDTKKSQHNREETLQKKVPKQHLNRFLQSPSDVLSFRAPCYCLLMETPSYIQDIDYSHRQQAIDTCWSAVIAISLILQPIPQKVVGMKPEAAKHKQFQ